MLKSGQTWTGIFVTKDATGALVAPSVGPVGTLYVNGIANAAVVTVSGTNPYTFSVALPTITAGQSVSLFVTATVSGVATAWVVAADIVVDVADDVWDEILTGATHNIATSAGRRLRQIASSIIYDGIAVSSTENTITLDAGASAVNGAYDPALIYIVNGTGAGQCRLILEYTGATRRAVVDRDWKILPDATSEYVLAGDVGREHVNEGLATDGTETTIVLNANASDADDAYIGQVVFIRSGTGEDQARRVQDYDGATHTVTVARAWNIIPDATSAYVMLPTGAISDQCIGNAVWTHSSATAVMAQLDEIQLHTDLIGTGAVVVVAPVLEDGDVEIVRGDVYKNADGRRLEWASDDWDIGATSSVVVVIRGAVVLTAVRLSATSVGLELTSAQSAVLPEGRQGFWIQEIQSDGEIVTLLNGVWVTMAQPTPLIEA